MPFNGSGTYNPIGGGDFPAVDGQLIRADQYNNEIYDIATALTSCLTRDGQSPPTANLPMAGMRLTGLGDGVSPQDSATVAQVSPLNDPAYWMGI